MMGVAVLHLFPHAVIETDSLEFASWSAMLGLLAMFFMIRFSHVHQHHPTEHHNQNDNHHGHADQHPLPEEVRPEFHVLGRHRLSWVGLFVGMTIHSWIDGIALAASVAAGVGQESTLGLLGVGTFVAVLLHKPLDALPITSVMIASGWSRRWREVVNLVFALMCPLGALSFYFGIQEMGSGQHLVVGCALGFSAGVFLCISLADILPEIQFHRHDRVKLSAVLLLGVALAYGIGLLEPGHAHQTQPPDSSHHQHTH
jgi:zinc and cadmium transporter